MSLVDQDLARRARAVTSPDYHQGHIDRAKEHQAEFDNAFVKWPMKAPPILADESLNDYERRLAKYAKRQLPPSYEIRKVQVNQLADDAFQVFKKQIYDVCKNAIRDPMTVAPGELRMLEVKDGDVLRERHFIGQSWFGTLDGSYGHRPGRRVKGFAVRFIGPNGHEIK